MLPTLALIQHEKTVDYVVGFDDLGGTDDFSTETLAARLEAQVGTLMGHLLQNVHAMCRCSFMRLGYWSPLAGNDRPTAEIGQRDTRPVSAVGHDLPGQLREHSAQGCGEETAASREEGRSAQPVG